MVFKNDDNRDSNMDVRRTGGRSQLPPAAGRICLVAAGLATWTPEEKAWLKAHPRLIAYHDQLQAALQEVQGQSQSIDFSEDDFALPAAGASRL